MMNNDEEKPFAQRQRENKVEKYECRCGHVSAPGQEVWEYRNDQGEGIYTHCPQCRGYAVAKDVVRDPETGKVIEVTPEEPTIQRLVRECLADDQRKGKKGSSSNNNFSRKKPLKRLIVRWEQDIPSFSNGRGGVIKVERLETASERVKLKFPVGIKAQIDMAGELLKHEGDRDWSPSRLLKRSFRQYVRSLELVKGIERGGEKVEVQLRLFPSEALILERATQEYDSSPTEVFAECFKMFWDEKK